MGNKSDSKIIEITQGGRQAEISSLPCGGSMASSTFVSSSSSAEVYLTQEISGSEIIETKEGRRRFGFVPLALGGLPSSVQTISASFPVDDANTLRKLLKPGYEARAKLSSFLFTDHNLPIHEVQFTIDEYDEEREKRRLREEQGLEGEKESKERKYKHKEKEAGDKMLPEDAWSSSLRHQRGGEGVQQPIPVTDIFKPHQQLMVSSSREEKDECDSKLSEQPIVSSFREKKKEDKSTLSVPESAIHRVLVLGEAGSGKTTLSKYIADRWINNELWPHYKQVFWITLRDLRDADKIDIAVCASSPSPLALMINRLCFDEESQKKITVETIDNLLKTQSRQTLVVLDGFDEVAQAFSEGDKLSKSIKVLLTVGLNTTCDLIVTSRGYSLPPSTFKFDRRLTN